MDNLLEVRDLKTQFFTETGVVRAVDGVSMTLRRGEVLGVVGESGCGKSVTALSIMQLIDNPGRIVEGQVLFDDEDLLKVSDETMRSIRGNRISMIFQQPQSCLNPVFRIGQQLSEVLGIHQGMGREAGEKRAVELLEMVGIPEPEKRITAYPHELSGGMAQRVMIAMAVACVPELLIADEPTTALDVTIQAQILDLMRDLQSKMETSIILITHDLGVVAEMCDRVIVMYAGRIVEEAGVRELFANPKHPYTQDLIGATPVLGQADKELVTIPGSVPNLVNLPRGCKFAPRCRARFENNLHICAEEEPTIKPVADAHTVRCWLYEEGVQ
ncbi:MAG: ABC transporter ATP-binding protein [Anaerolineales bacterium]|nr:ABC transporter ATP-binding protein [Anaerolineales bacterium]MCB8962658.1 ABC transporter ATP-binding protein [Ardenticatenales bacterium]